MWRWSLTIKCILTCTTVVHVTTIPRVLVLRAKTVKGATLPPQPPLTSPALDVTNTQKPFPPQQPTRRRGISCTTLINLASKVLFTCSVYDATSLKMDQLAVRIVTNSPRLDESVLH